MSFFDSILLNLVCTMFPLLAYLVYLACKMDINEKKESNMIFELVMITSIFLTVKLCGERYNNYSLILLNIPILFSYIRGKKYLALLLSFFVCFYYMSMLDYNKYMILFEYISYFVLYTIADKKETTPSKVINRFVLLKAFFFSFFVFYLDMESTFLSIFINVFVCVVVFCLASKIYYMLLCKGEEIVNLNNSIKDLEREKTLRNSLFKLTHEIKNPIAVCKGYLDMLDLENKITSSKYISVIKGEIDRTLVIMDDFLDYTKIKVTKDIMDANYLLEDTLNSMNLLLKKNNVDLKVNIPDDEVFIEGDYNRLKQVIVNILKNSIEAKKEKVELNITVSAKIEEKKFYICIKDNGVGMDFNELNSIGKSFYTTKIKGTGLGVLLSKEIIELHEGDIIYTSTKGRGTKVSIVLPILEL